MGQGARRAKREMWRVVVHREVPAGPIDVGAGTRMMTWARERCPSRSSQEYVLVGGEIPQVEVASTKLEHQRIIGYLRDTN